MFNEVTLTLYGKQEVVKMMAANLLWRPIGDALQFVWVISSRGSIVLMCSDLTVAPALIVELYCRRVRIEILFDTLKKRARCVLFPFLEHLSAPSFAPPHVEPQLEGRKS
ncbi:hypothetical protein [Methylocucumis oryzae]|uniref:hypothetical protein n=1 Tax=Methylocucumis oryzae TaxID=1632867 RepID=UPI001955480A|nr:hypothetical protein [Methylocucumis oryzae]